MCVSELEYISIQYSSEGEFFRENQVILEHMSQSGTIDTHPVKDEELLQIESLVNKDDLDLQSVFIATYLFDRPDNAEKKDNLSMLQNRQAEDDYDVDDLLRNALISWSAIQ